MTYTDPIIAEYMARNPVPLCHKFTLGRGTSDTSKSRACDEYRKAQEARKAR